MSNYCHVSAQISINADEPEAPECECCAKPISEDDLSESICNDCSYEADMKLDHLTEQTPNV